LNFGRHFVPGTLGAIEREFPFVDPEYREFLRFSNGLQIDMYNFFSCYDSGQNSIAKAVQRWKPTIGDEGLPIGEDPSGDGILLCKDGRIRLVNIYLNNAMEGRVLAISFSDFMSDVLMGPLFPSLFPKGWNVYHENKWTQFMRHNKWI
jgi:hypothetical protein